ncbi:MAG: GNAT family N-acetyltransferase [Candidatus Moranbacteria bacterium]|nr:GNAT family N-acetyltransferase [Candidatus Moranbacteria bacterium]
MVFRPRIVENEPGTTVVRITSAMEYTRAVGLFVQLAELYQEMNIESDDDITFSDAIGRYHNHFLIILEGDTVVAAATIILGQTTSRCIGFIEDVIISKDARNTYGVLETELIRQAIVLAAELGCRSLQYFQNGTCHRQIIKR